MKEQQDYIRDIAEMRSMMERSSKFLSLSGLAGVMAGIYALAGAYVAHKVLAFNPVHLDVSYVRSEGLSKDLAQIILLGLAVLVLAIATAIFLSYKKAVKRREKIWNPTSRRLLIHTAVPLVAGGLLILIFIAKGLIGFLAPFSLIFYGLALYNAGKFTYGEIRSLGLIQVVLGLISAYYVGSGLLCWALGFGVFHIVYGAFMHYKYER